MKLSSLPLILAPLVSASLDPNSPSSFGYSQSYSVDLSSDIESSGEEPTIVTSSLIFEESQQPDECYISSMALMSPDMFDGEDMSSDDEDEDDDGSCSMLSNASLKRVSIGGDDSPVAPRQPPAFLNMRGGAVAAPALGSEVLRKLFVVALVTLVYEGMVGHILEFVKIVMQTAPADTSYGQVLSTITAEKGIAGLWDGFIPWGVVQAIFKGAVFGLAHATASGFLLPLAEEGKLPVLLALTLAGGIGGGFQGFVLSPTLLLKTRVMTNPVFREKMSLLRTTWLSFLIGAEVVQKEGFMTLMKGANVFATKRVFDWATRFLFSDLFESAFLSVLKLDKLTVTQKMTASLLGGVASTCCTLPLDVLVAKTQDAKKAGVAVSPVKLFTDELSEKGWSGLRDSYMRGFEARLLHVCTTTMVIKTGTPIVYDLIFPKTEPSA